VRFAWVAGALALLALAAPAAADVARLFADDENLDVTIWPGFPDSYDSTRHIDMWRLPAGPRRAIVGE